MISYIFYTTVITLKWMVWVLVLSSLNVAKQYKNGAKGQPHYSGNGREKG